MFALTHILLLGLTWEGGDGFVEFAIGLSLVIVFLWSVLRVAESMHSREYTLTPQQIKIGVYDATINEETVGMIPTMAFVHRTIPFLGASIEFRDNDRIVKVGFYETFADRVLFAELATRVYPDMQVITARQASPAERKWIEAEKGRILGEQISTQSRMS